MGKERNQNVTFCYTCGGVELIWDNQSKGWIAHYVDGAVYCDCSDLPIKGLDKPWSI